MLKAGVERCSGTDALYLRIDPSCPTYWVRWDSVKIEADLDVVSGIPHRGSRDSILALVACSLDGTGSLSVRRARNKPSATSGGRDQSPRSLNPGCGRIVGTEAFATRASSRANDSEEEDTSEGEEEKEEEE